MTVFSTFLGQIYKIITIMTGVGSAPEYRVAYGTVTKAVLFHFQVRGVCSIVTHLRNPFRNRSDGELRQTISAFFSILASVSVSALLFSSLRKVLSCCVRGK